MFNDALLNISGIFVGIASLLTGFIAFKKGIEACKTGKIIALKKLLGGPPHHYFGRMAKILGFFYILLSIFIFIVFLFALCMVFSS